MGTWNMAIIFTHSNNHSAVSKYIQIIKYYLQNAPLVQWQNYEMENSEISAPRVATATNFSLL